MAEKVPPALRRLFIDIARAHKQQAERIEQLGKMIAPHRKPIKPRQTHQKVAYMH